ncbi:MAG TPA: hypothetical protein VFZ42_07360 [Chitinophagaceae bacterium]
MSKKNKKVKNHVAEDKKFPLPIYDKKDDIFNRGLVEPLEEEDIPWIKESGVNGSNLGDELDIPGAEIDDADESVGEEDEENNYYSLGGDNHNDLEENKG